MIQKLKKRSVGRPALSDKEKRSVTVHARITVEDKKNLDRYLNERDLSLTQLILNAIDKTPAK